MVFFRDYLLQFQLGFSFLYYILNTFFWDYSSNTTLLYSLLHWFWFLERLQETHNLEKKKKKKLAIVLGKVFWRLLILFLEFFMFMCMYVLGLIELELSLKLWFWLNNENGKRSMFQYLESSIYVLLSFKLGIWIVKLLIHSFIVHLLIMNNNIAIYNHHDMVSMMWSF